jgi:UDPglucose 6-dehydrogenase
MDGGERGSPLPAEPDVSEAKQMKIGIIGVGMVGGTLAHGFQKIGHEVLKHDVKLDTSIVAVFDAPIVFICVPTPQAENGSCDTSIVRRVISSLYLSGYPGLIVIKSTVPPGTTDDIKAAYPSIKLAFCPEFLREKTSYTDFIDDHEVLITGTYYHSDADLIKQAHGNLPKQVVDLSPLDAEFTKYFSNVFNALRVVFANQFYEVCEAAGANYQEVKNAVTKRSSIGHHYLDCNKSFREFGGNCLPKDSSAFAKFVDKLGLGHLKMFQRIVEDNEAIRARAREAWEFEKNTGLEEYNAKTKTA